jgi:hypothetical protein
VSSFFGKAKRLKFGKAERLKNGKRKSEEWKAETLKVYRLTESKRFRLLVSIY